MNTIIVIAAALLIGLEIYILFSANRMKREGKLKRSLFEIEKSSIELERELKMLFEQLKSRVNTPIPKQATRVYGAILNRLNENALYLAAADDADTFVNNGKLVLGDSWHAQAISYVDVFPPPAEKEKVIVREPTRTERRRLSVDEFVHHMEYARDSFTDKEYQKRAVNLIIKNIKTRYASA